MDARWGIVAAGAGAVAVGVALLAGQKRGGALGMIEDPRLPDQDPKLVNQRLNSRRAEPRRSAVEARHTDALGHEHLIRRHNNRWWYQVTSTSKVAGWTGNVLDYAHTTSKKIADGWIAAINEAAKAGA